ncbi:DUF484 family protein [Rhodobacter sphaeroides]|jgi:hypothetical protein|uniref:DUF484 family protein n=1 Tax=Cereibacter sphaeroides (strain ATCC 17023 / DSM 158 / JCM 6121 / CCUG 31486 / LMG 2827 / NBRC 12203 / NCIMB 8253 / ATH 2.4.1.) TaxID=272943 RepID=Q3J0E9_CERS4|nr:DUF484 family protein [Cereibacter sphaeroides]ABA79735.1 hypothetical protein RSP_0562 [Cereibacter sphaeroides 2.4.1]AMJ48019.1 recombinase XerC [Cereibacter sphaeroides]ANS34728.1 recombinase XerC [Cereibacter sphaeroides]ATN63776.1 recombinase XerC [Cereibacter sphaeroides]AZB54654.1 DUF484 family protein [Cereibacter sphaeroides]
MIEQDLRDKILASPEVILEDRDLMKALIAANERAMGANVIDLRGIAMERLEGRLDRLEDTHRSVIAAAYENLAGTNLIHRAILQMLDPFGFEEFLLNLSTEVAQTLRVESIRLVLESPQREADPAIDRLGGVLQVVEPGFVADYVAGGRNVPLRTVTLRRALPGTALYGELSPRIASEALMRLDFGRGRLPGMLVMGSEDPEHFKPTQGTDLLAFFAAVFERTMRRWLS